MCIRDSGEDDRRFIFSASTAEVSDRFCNIAKNQKRHVADDHGNDHPLPAQGAHDYGHQARDKAGAEQRVVGVTFHLRYTHQQVAETLCEKAQRIP